MVTDSRKLVRTASSAPPVDLRRLLGYVGEDPLGGGADSRPVSAEDEARDQGLGALTPYPNPKTSCKLAVSCLDGCCSNDLPLMVPVGRASRGGRERDEQCMRLKACPAR